MAPLDDVTVVALEQAVAAPLATRHLADWGARVIKIERPEVGDFARRYDATVKGLSSHFVWLNRSKQSLTLDAKSNEGREILQRLLKDADVFIQNLAPGAAGRLGLGSDDLTRKFPSLIVCNISGYGNDGPLSHRKAYDLLVQAESGLLSVTGTKETPSKAGISVADIAAGMYAYSGILAALLRRHKTGNGAVVNVSLFDALTEWMSYPAYFSGYGGNAPARTGADHATIAPYGPYRASDDRLLMIGLQNDREWSSFCRIVLERADLIDDPRFSENVSRVRHREQLDEVIEQVLVGLDSGALVARLEQASIAYGRINTMQDLFEHPQLSQRGRWASVQSTAGPIDVLVPPVGIDNEQATMGAIPGVGEQTDAILASLGYTEQDIVSLREAKIL